MVLPNPQVAKMEQQRNTYEDILNNFESFCDNFEVAAAERFSGQDNDSRQPIDNGEVQRVTPAVVREVKGVGAQDIPIIPTRPDTIINGVESSEVGEENYFVGDTTIDVPSTE